MSSKAARRQALGWVYRLDTPEQIRADGPEFETWLARSSEHGAAYYLAERARCEIEVCREAIVEVGGVSEEGLVNRIKRQYAPRLARKARRIGFPLTAAIATIAVIVLW